MLRRFPFAVTVSCLTLAVFFAGLYSITVGPMNITISDSIQSLLFRSEQLTNAIHLVIHDIRLPRTLLCLLVGAILALCGTAMQGLFRNPLAEPGIIGVSSGASLGAALAIVLLSDVVSSLPWVNSLVLPIAAFIGGALTTVLVYRLGTSKFGTSVTIMLLAGVAISALAGAGIGYLNYLASDQMLRDLTLWSMGSVAGATTSSILLCSVTLIMLFAYFHWRSMALNALLLGEAEARHLGVPVQKLKREMILLSAVGVGVAVSAAGMIGFVGLVVPHIGRMLVGPDHRNLVPVSTLLGALMLTLADMIARVAVAPAELPIGIVTALVGAPFFLYLLFQQKGRIF
ncbi:TPA: FecCD family ABC transporter permease [Vibrio cholerae]|nr:iron ABC transporter permease [Vibrio cholerae]EGR4216170.1 iron ABC transporter permease [Vibrio cholerae]EGR4252385.1 iron ABC transporter permease [Vibrio cholerae]ELE2133106.1 iron ABC transporter permease [Vibrio cholerae]ELJ8606873.1 iron ABC transporter permease [Vibrio cholerae]